LPSFEHSANLLLLLLLPVMVLLFKGLLRWKSDVVRRIGDQSLVRAMLGDLSQRGDWLRFLLFSAAFVLCVLGLANLQTPRPADTRQRGGIDVMFALDVSRSMYAEDVAPSRLQVSRQMMARVMERLPDARIGLVLFAGRAYLQMPLTFDHASAVSFLSAAGPESVPSQGTAIAEALTLSATALSIDDRTQKVLLMVTDGEDHEAGISEAAGLIRESGILLLLAGVGTEAGAPLKNPETGLTRLDADGRPVTTRLNEEFLKSLAKDAGGLYLGSSQGGNIVEAVLDRVDALEKTPLATPVDSRHASHFQWFLGSALLLLLIEYLYRDKTVRA
jgi:Ca-activated chloride channel family protein